MSNRVSLYVASPDDCFAALRNIDRDADERVKLRDYLAGRSSDVYTAALAELYEGNPDPEAFADSSGERIVKLITWSWVGEERPADFPAEAGELFLDVALSPERIAGMREDVAGFRPDAVAGQLYGPAPTWRDVFSSQQELRDYLDLWRVAFADALRNRHGLFYKVWV